MTAHTPGPWTIDATGHDALITTRDQEVCVVWNGGQACGEVEAREEAYATALIINEAPAMVAMLRAVINSLTEAQKVQARSILARIDGGNGNA